MEESVKSIADSLQTLVREGLPLLRVLAGKKTLSLVAERERKARRKAEPPLKSQIDGDGSVSMRHLNTKLLPSFDRVDYRLPYERWAQVLLLTDDATTFLKYLPRSYRCIYKLKDSKVRAFKKGNGNRGCVVFANGLRPTIKHSEFFGGAAIDDAEFFTLVMWRWYSKHMEPIMEHINNTPVCKQEFENKSQQFQKLICLSMIGDYAQTWNGLEINDGLCEATDIKSRNMVQEVKNLAAKLEPSFFCDLDAADRELETRAFNYWRGTACNEYTRDLMKKERNKLINDMTIRLEMKRRFSDSMMQTYWELMKYDLSCPKLQTLHTKYLLSKV